MKSTKRPVRLWHRRQTPSHSPSPHQHTPAHHFPLQQKLRYSTVQLSCRHNATAQKHPPQNRPSHLARDVGHCASTALLAAARERHDPGQARGILRAACRGPGRCICYAHVHRKFRPVRREVRAPFFFASFFVVRRSARPIISLREALMGHD